MLLHLQGIFPRMDSVRTWDLEDGDAQLLAGVPDREIDKSVHGVVQINREGIVRVEPPRLRDQAVREIAINAPIAFLVRIAQIAASDVSANSEMIKLGFMRSKQTSISRKLSRNVNCANAMLKY